MKGAGAPVTELFGLFNWRGAPFFNAVLVYCRDALLCLSAAGRRGTKDLAPQPWWRHPGRHVALSVFSTLEMVCGACDAVTASVVMGQK